MLHLQVQLCKYAVDRMRKQSNAIMTRKPPKLDPDIKRDDVPMRDLRDVFKMLLRDAPNRPRSENREPTKEEVSRRWKLERR